MATTVAGTDWDGLVIGEEYEGVVNAFTTLGILVGFGGPRNGLVLGTTIPGKTNDQIRSDYPQGTKLRVQISKVDRRKGLIGLKIVNIGWSELVAGDEYEGVVTMVVNRNVFVGFGAPIDGFVQASSTRDGRTTAQIRSDYPRGTKIWVKITQVNQQKEFIRLKIAPRLDFVTEDKIIAGWSELVVGDEYQGVVIGSRKFGILVGFGGPRNGLIPIAAMSGTTADQIQSDYPPGKKVQVLITQADQKADRIVLKLVSDPNIVTDWSELVVGDEYEGVVLAARPSDIFVDFGGPRNGRIPLSALPAASRKQIRSDYPKGTTIQVQITDVDQQTDRIILKLVLRSNGVDGPASA